MNTDYIYQHMMRRIIIKNGKKYLVNVPSYGDGDCGWMEGGGAGPYEGNLTFVGSSLVITNQEILDTYAGSIDQSGQTWLECHGYYCSNLVSLDVNANSLTILDLRSNTALTTLDCSGNDLTTLDISTNTALTTLDCNNNQLTQPAVDKILTDLVANAQISGTLDVSGRGNEAPTSKAGGSNYDVLSNTLGWSVSTN